MKEIFKMLMAVLFNSLVGGLLATVIGLPAVIGAVALNLLSLAVGKMAPNGCLRTGVLTEIWTGEMVKSLRRGLEATFLDGIPDQSGIVNNDVIHLVDVGVDPEVVINNSTYPIPLQALDDKDIAIKLDKFQTKVTPVTDDELYASGYDKMARVKESHANALNDSKFSKAAHALCAKENTALTPVLKTTGKRDAVTGRRKMTAEDLLNMKRAMDNLKVPTQGRRLVLCSDHVNDLLEISQAFKEQYNINRNDGTVGRLYGFDIYEYGNTPLYTQEGKKKDVGSSADTGEFQCSFSFYTSRVFKATGTTKMYYSEAGTDPEYQRNKINFRHYFICMPKKADAGVVVMSDYKDPNTPEG